MGEGNLIFNGKTTLDLDVKICKTPLRFFAFPSHLHTFIFLEDGKL